MIVTYEIRTKRNARVWVYDDLEMARIGAQKHQERIGCAVHLVKVTKLEEVIQ
jgi:hypothetical protein